MKSYDHKKQEKRWQKKWDEAGVFKTPEDATPENKFYILPQLPYPSGSGLHVGHAEVYTACDIYVRFQRMRGKKVLQVFGLDSFGLPAENYAIKTNVHPKKTIDQTTEMFVSQVKSLGVSVDWDRFVRSSDPDYYKWTQWFFLLMYKRGLAYRKKQSVNWCENCKTVLANEQVTNEGVCERCETEVVQREMEQWFLKITEYADRLVADLDKVDWPEETKRRQRNWIGRSEGAMIRFGLHTNVKSSVVRRLSSVDSIEVFTTRPDTIFGATYLVLAPESEIVRGLKSEVQNEDEVEKYINETKKKTELDRQTEKEKTGVELKGIKAVNPANGEEIPVWIADYVLATYGTGAIMAVPAHDDRDWEFAKSNKLVIKPVILPMAGSSTPGADSETIKKEEIEKIIQEGAYLDDGRYIDSGFLTTTIGYGVARGKQAAIQWLEEHGHGERKVTYKLRDWSVSRQRFWGAPIPMLKNEQEKEKKRQYVLIHGRTGTADGAFLGWLKDELTALGHRVVTLDLPGTDIPDATEQAAYIAEQVTLDADTVIVAHSHGGPVAFRLLEHTNQHIAKLVLVDTVLSPRFSDGVEREFRDRGNFVFDFEKICSLPRETVVIADKNYPVIRKEDIDETVRIFDARLATAKAHAEHFTSEKEEIILDESIVYGVLPLGVANLPVLLPDDVDFKPTGESPLKYSENFQKGVEEKHGKGWKREADTLDTFMCSSWYYYRYLDPNNNNEFASPERLKKWMPVDFYLGGEEHVNGHLLYSRFFTKVLYDAGYIDFDEPFTVNRHQGLILGEDNRKMSKRWGNVINPTDIVNEYGADTLRMYEMFMGPLEDTKPWSTDGVRGVKRFLKRVWRLQSKVIPTQSGQKSKVESKVEKLLHVTIKKVGEDLSNLKFNTAVAKLMELSNVFMKEEQISREHFEIFLKMLSPLAPHMAEELWHELGNKSLISSESWPEYDEAKLVDDLFKIVVQVNGKVRANIEIPADLSEEDVKQKALEHENVQKWLDGKEPKKVIYVNGKLVSIVV